MTGWERATDTDEPLADIRERVGSALGIEPVERHTLPGRTEVDIAQAASARTLEREHSLAIGDGVKTLAEAKTRGLAALFAPAGEGE